MGAFILGIMVTLTVLLIAGDISRGRQGYDSVYYRFYVPHTGPLGGDKDANLSELRNLRSGEQRWIKSGFGCEYLMERRYDAKWKYHMGLVHGARSRWGLPCHEANWWRSRFILHDGPDQDAPPGHAWRARTIKERSGFSVRWEVVKR